MFNCIVLLFFLISLSDVVLAGAYEGDTCPLKNGGEGTCKLITKCPSAIKLIQSRIFPEHCGFVGTQVIVCCPNEGSKQTPSISTAATVTRPTTTTARSTITRRFQVTASVPKPISVSATNTNKKPGDISKKKCKEYAQYAYDKSEAPTLPLFTQHINVLECPFTKLPLIVGGSLAEDLEFPHMALIGRETGGEVDWDCGGSIISENYILTAAHCIRTLKGPPTLVRVGLTSKSNTEHMQELTVSEKIIHPDYVPKYNDIGLLKLSQNINLNIYARPACLQTERNIRFEKAIASGWGLTENSGSNSNNLLKVVLEFFSQEQCNKTFRRDIGKLTGNVRNGIIDNLMLCAGSSTEIKDTCQGDSGGPLQVYHDENEGVKCMYDIVGVTSFGKACGVAQNLPGVYTRVSNYIKWIEDIVWP